MDDSSVVYMIRRSRDRHSLYGVLVEVQQRYTADAVDILFSLHEPSYYAALQKH